MEALCYRGAKISLKGDAAPRLFPEVEAMLMPSIIRKTHGVDDRDPPRLDATCQCVTSVDTCIDGPM